MASDMLNIAASGTRAAQAALNVTSQNIANVNTDGYVRRSVTQADVASFNTMGGGSGLVTLGGVRVTGTVRDVDAYQQSEVRRTGSDAARADTLVTGLTNVNNAVDNSGLYDSITAYQTALSKLAASPTDSALRANALEAGRTMAQSFNQASSALTATKTGLVQGATAGVTQVNTLATNLATLNQKIASTPDPSAQADLLDQRDTMLQQLSQYGDVTTTIASNGTVQVQMGGTSGPVLVSGSTANTLAMSQDSTGAISYTVGGSALSLSGGSLAGQQQAMTAAISAGSSLDTIANSMMSTVNSAQTNGAALDGSAGQAMFSGSGAAGITLALTSGSQIATAPSGSAANSSDASNLNALISSLKSTDIAGQTNNLILTTSTAVSSNTTTRDALDAIYSNAQSTMSAQSGVSLDEEAANLVRYQQAYQASGKVIQVAQTLFNQLLQI
ncbi:flagellar hook-associated protein FlgK [Novosphingobium rosa]|uniref:flagellar hook-associated protein FlgK n=1 Tax=Novosphingobium rosa TaxID=76978 RepID=UPI0008374338|nr:flagellar hook-associated protein FlgK [Novosphingobium rosa]